MPIWAPPIITPAPLPWGGTAVPWLLTTDKVSTILATVRPEWGKRAPAVAVPAVSLPSIGPPRTTDKPAALAANPFMVIGVT